MSIIQRIIDKIDAALNPLPERFVPQDDCHQSEIIESEDITVPEFLKKTALSYDEQVRALALLAASTFDDDEFVTEDAFRQSVKDFEGYIKTGQWS